MIYSTAQYNSLNFILYYHCSRVLFSEIQFNRWELPVQTLFEPKVFVQVYSFYKVIICVSGKGQEGSINLYPWRDAHARDREPASDRLRRLHSDRRIEDRPPALPKLRVYHPDTWSYMNR